MRHASRGNSSPRLLKSRVKPYRLVPSPTLAEPLSRPFKNRFEVGGSEGPPWSRRRRIEKFVGVCVIVSGSTHGLVTQEHFQEWWGYGVFFLATSVCLIGFGLALITDAIDPRYMPGDVRRIRRLMYAIGAIGNASILGLYLLTRTVGVPLGPGSGSVESVGVVDVVAKTAELLAVAGLVVLVLKSRPRVTG